MTETTVRQSDAWSDWLLHHRHGGDPDVAHAILLQTEKYADRVLGGATIAPGMTLLDVGTGDGLVAFKAIGRVGPSLKVVLTDISAPLLRHVEALANERGIGRQCVYVECSAEDLQGIADASVDVVVTRAVLAYVANKPRALDEFFRVLKPGGYLSICEPIMRDEALVVYALKAMIDAQPPASRDRLLELQCRVRAAQYPDTIEKISQHPLTNFTERDLVRMAQGARFKDVHMEFHIDTNLESLTDWEVFLDSSPHPLAAPVRQIIAEQFSEDERHYFIEKFRPVIEAGQSMATSQNAYLTARKPDVPTKSTS
jgi:ubiquinone/menaquinone biosynthesis C-methylase UbiE